MLQTVVSPSSWREWLRMALAAAPPRVEDYPDRLRSPRVERPQLPTAWKLLALLLLFTFVPRALMAFRVGVVCSDGAYYISLAEALERGDMAHALNMQFNLFPPVLAVLHQLGLSWEAAGKVWGVLMSTLVVLPLFGWVRRQFDDRVAAVACALYAVHPELIEWSPEIVREPTFWFAFTLSLYLLWRAATEVRLAYFFAAGLSIAATALTRFEGLFLLVPLVGWGGLRLLALREQRPKLVLGIIACPLALPTLLLLLNLCWLHHESPWNLLRIEPWKRVEHWIATLSHDTENGSTVAAVVPAPYDASPLAKADKHASPSMIWMFVHAMERGLTPFFGLLMIGGYAAWHRLFNRRDQLPLLVVGALVCGGIWIHIWYTQQTSSRYVMSIVIMSSRCAALGLISLGYTVSRWRPTFVPACRQPVGAIVIMIGLLTVIGWVDALTTQFRSRIQSAELGQWIRNHYGEPRMICGIEEQLPIISYHAHAYYWEPPRGVSGASLMDLVDKNKPEVIVVGSGAERAKDFTQLINEGHRIGFNQVDPALLPDASGRVVVLSRLPMLR